MTKRTLAVALAFALAAPTSAAAQEGEASERGQLLGVTTWEVDPADAPAFEAAVKQIVEAAGISNIGPDNVWAFWQYGSQYTLVGRVENFADYDTPGDFQRAFQGTPGEAQMQEAMAKFPALKFQVVSEEVVEILNDWSYAVESFNFDDLKYAHVDVFWPRTGMNEEFDQLNKDWVAFFKELGYPYPYDAHEVHFGDTGRNIYVTFVDDLGRFYGENSLMKMIEAKNMGERRKQLNERFGKVIARWTHYDASFRPDLTYWPMPEGATN